MIQEDNHGCRADTPGRAKRLSYTKRGKACNVWGALIGTDLSPYHVVASGREFRVCPCMSQSQSQDMATCE